MQTGEEIGHIGANVPNVAMKTAENEEVPGMFEEVVHENKVLRKEVEREENEMKSKLLKDSDNEDHERKTKQLMFLLTRTHFYATHLAERIHAQSRRISETDSRVLADIGSERGTTRSSDIQESKNRKRKFANEGYDEKVIVDCIANMQKGKLQIEGNKTKTTVSSVPFGQLKFFDGPNLKDYQLKGVEWLKCLYENAVNGILADEMGLGKTVQVIALICHLVSKKVFGPFLVIAPLSTLLSWIYEFQKFAPKIPTLLFHGSAIQRYKLTETFAKQSCDGISMYPVVITTYEISLREKQFFMSYVWEYIIVDEAQRLKNYKCLLSKFLREIKSKNRLLLTGTPLQNNLSELWSLLNFLIPEVFNDLTVFESWVSTDELKENETIVEKEAQSKIISKMHQILSPFILRRLKSDVEINLPPKKEILIYAPMTKLQWELYTSTMDGTINIYLGKQKEEPSLSSKRRHCTQDINYIELSDDENNEEFNNISTCTNSTGSNTLENKIFKDKEGNVCKIFLKMQNPAFQLRKISNHPYLIQMPLDPETKGILIDENIVKKSGKMLVLDLLLPKLKSLNHRVLLFSTMTMLLDVIEEYVILRKYRYVRLDGEICFKDRSDNINEFIMNPDIFLFLISTRAGGLGLNLTSADTVIIFDSDWNPQVDLQAQDRCHRIGQTKPVVVYRFVTSGTIDEKIVTDASRKKKLGKLILHKDLSKEKDLNKMERTISLQELKALLESKDYTKVVHTSGEVFTERELNDILDRRECTFE